MTRFGIIGCGYQTTKNMAPAMAKSGVSEITGFFDLDSRKAEALGQAYGAPAFRELAELLNSKEVDAVYIATPISTHAELCKAAADSGKHILCEKSLALNPEQDAEIRAYCQSKGVRLLEGFMYQYHTQHGFVREMIAQGEIGEPVLFQAWFGFPPFPETDFRMIKELGGGALLDAGAYVIHAAKNFFGREPVSEHRAITYNGKGLDIQGSILMDFGLGQSALLSYGMNNSYKNSYSVWGTQGEITLLRAFSIPEQEIPLCRIVNQGLTREYKLQPCNHFVEELKAFHTLINER